MKPLDAVHLTSLMDRTSGRPEISVGLIDGPVLLSHPDLARQNIQEVSGRVKVACERTESTACMHGTFVAGILCAQRGSSAPAICPGCRLMVRPIFTEYSSESRDGPSATAKELADAIIDCVNAGVRVVNLSAALLQHSSTGVLELEEALDYAGSRGLIIVAAAGNQGMVGSSKITGHPSVIPVAACDAWGMVLPESNLGGSIGTRGVLAPGNSITSLGTNGKTLTFGGTSAAAPFVSGAIALLWSEFPRSSANEIRRAVTQVWARRRRAIVPPLLNAWAAYQSMA
jgi:subtilisin family serine protease